MKSLKKFLLTTAMTMIVGTSAFAASGFEFILNVPLGVGIGIPTKSMKESEMKSRAGFDGGVTAQLGYMFQVVDGFGISVLGELGYAFSSYVVEMKSKVDISIAQDGSQMVDMATTPYFNFHSFQIGLLPKFNIGAFAIGIGGGVKIPVAGEQVSKGKYAGESYNNKVKWKSADIKDFINPAVIGYIKGTFDYSIFFTDNLAFNIGLYLAGDIATQKASAGEKKENMSTFDVGVELGLKFGPKA